MFPSELLVLGSLHSIVGIWFQRRCDGCFKARKARVSFQHDDTAARCRRWSFHTRRAHSTLSAQNWASRVAHGAPDARRLTRTAFLACSLAGVGIFFQQDSDTNEVFVKTIVKGG